MENNTLTINYEGEPLQIEIVSSENDLQYMLQFDHPVYIKKEVDAQGISTWVEVGMGETLRAKEIGQAIESHPEFL